MGDDYETFRAAHEGDHGPLIELLRSGADVTPERRVLLIKILEGKLKRPPHRQGATLKDQAVRRSLVRRVRELESGGCKQTAAVAQVAAESGRSERTVRSALRLARDTVEMKRLVDQATAAVAQTEHLLANTKVGEPRHETATKLHEIAVMLLEGVSNLYRKVGLTLENN
jgi:hypothetical protein